MRRREQATALDRIESEKAAFHARVEAAYEKLAQQEPQRFITVDARKQPESITADILNALFERLDAAEVV